MGKAFLERGLDGDSERFREEMQTGGKDRLPLRLCDCQNLPHVFSFAFVVLNTVPGHSRCARGRKHQGVFKKASVMHGLGSGKDRMRECCGQIVEGLASLLSY